MNQAIESNNIHLDDGLLDHDQFLSHVVVLLANELVGSTRLPALRLQFLVGHAQGLVAPGDLVAFRAGEVHQVVELVVLHLVGQLQVLLEQGLLLALDALVSEEQLELPLGLQLCLLVLNLQVLIDLHPVPLVGLGQQEGVELLQVLHPEVEELRQHEDPRDVFEGVGYEEEAAFLVGPVQLVGDLDFAVHFLEQFDQLVPLLRLFLLELVDDAGVNLQETAFLEVEFGWELLGVLGEPIVELLALEPALEDEGGGVQGLHDLVPSRLLQDVVAEVGHLDHLLRDLVAHLFEVDDVTVVVPDLPVLRPDDAPTQRPHPWLSMAETTLNRLSSDARTSISLGVEKTSRAMKAERSFSPRDSRGGPVTFTPLE